MLDAVMNSLNVLSLQVFLISMLLFFLGYAAAPTVYYKNIRWLKAYPMWIALKLERWALKKWHPILLFFFIFGINALSLSLNLFSGLIPLLPVVFALWTGLNIGVVTYHTLNGHFFYASLINPVAVFELPAAFIAFSLALQYNMRFWGFTLFHVKNAPLAQYVHFFIITVVPLLVLAAIIESALILLSQKLEDNNRDQ